jgi:hypothetical protein
VAHPAPITVLGPRCCRRSSARDALVHSTTSAQPPLSRTVTFVSEETDHGAVAAIDMSTVFNLALVFKSGCGDRTA